jgi:hypothetical protein
VKLRESSLIPNGARFNGKLLSQIKNVAFVFQMPAKIPIKVRIVKIAKIQF